MPWSVETLDKRVDKELCSLPRDLIARFLRISEFLTDHGPENVSMPHVKSLYDGLWEMRMSGKDGIARAIESNGQTPGRGSCLPKEDTEDPEKTLRSRPEEGKRGSMTSLKELKKAWLSDPDNQVSYDDLGPEFDLARKLIAARAAAGLSQAQVAERMGTKQSEVSRIEGARQNVSYAKLRSYAKAAGAKLNISLEPAG